MEKLRQYKWVIWLTVGFVVAFVIYHRGSVVACTKEAGEYVKANWETLDSVSGKQAMYSFVYRNCMSRHGFER